MQVQKGFSLIELLIVVAIIGIIAAIAVPSLIKSRRAAEESSAVGCLRSYTSAQFAYQATRGGHQLYGIEPELADGFIDPVFVATPYRNGYKFTFNVPSDRTEFSANADPTDNEVSSRHYYVDHSGVIRYKVGAPASMTSTVIGSGT